MVYLDENGFVVVKAARDEGLHNAFNTVGLFVKFDEVTDINFIDELTFLVDHFDKVLSLVLICNSHYLSTVCLFNDVHLHVVPHYLDLECLSMRTVSETVRSDAELLFILITDADCQF